MRRTRPRRLSLAVLVAATITIAACGSSTAESVDSGSAGDASAVGESVDERTSQDASVADGEAVVGSVTVADIEDAESRFDSSVGRDYVVTFEFVSSATAVAGPIRVEVADGSAVEAVYPDAVTEQLLPSIPMLTVNDFFDRARAVLADGGRIEIEFDEPYGHPTTMTLDPIPGAIDDELSIVVRSVEPLERSVEPDGY